jgi:predicted alpha/beta hydrolase
MPTAVIRRKTRVQTSDGFELAVTSFFTEQARRAALILPATGVTQDRYEVFATFLAARGWYVVTFDYRGIGSSAASGAFRDQVSMQAWGEKDLTAVIDWVGRETTPQRLVAVAHSIGGQILPLAHNSDRIDAVLGIAIQKGYWRLWDGPTKYGVCAFFRFYVPLCIRLFGYVPLAWAGLHHLEKNAARDYARWTMNLGYTDEREKSLIPRFAQFRAPILALSFADDTRYAPRRAVDFLMRHYYLQAPVWRCHLSPDEWGLAGLGHSGFFNPAQCPAAFWQEASDWLGHASEGRPLRDFTFNVFQRAVPLTDKKRLDPAICRSLSCPEPGSAIS